jgi:hypothetical protein
LPILGVLNKSSRHPAAAFFIRVVSQFGWPRAPVTVSKPKAGPCRLVRQVNESYWLNPRPCVLHTPAASGGR